MNQAQPVKYLLVQKPQYRTALGPLQLNLYTTFLLCNIVPNSNNFKFKCHYLGCCCSTIMTIELQQRTKLRAWFTKMLKKLGSLWTEVV
jgi:hypothetical protein